MATPAPTAPHNPKCVKCGGNHLSTTCSKSPELPAKCALCEGAHPANYKGGTVYKQLTCKHNNFSSKKSQQPLPSTSNNPNNTPPATAFSSKPQPRSYANVTEGHIPPKPNPMSSNNNESELLKFINEFKAIINPLIALLTTVLSNITNINNAK